METKTHIKSVEKFVYKLKQILLRKRGISLDQRLKELKYIIHGWVNYFRIADMKTLLQGLDSRIRRKCRVVIWKQWKKSKKRYTSLRELGITHIAHTRVLENAISKERLNKRGLVNSLVYYLKVHIITN